MRLITAVMESEVTTVLVIVFMLLVVIVFKLLASVESDKRDLFMLALRLPM